MASARRAATLPGTEDEAVPLRVPRGETPGYRQVEERKLSLRLKLENSRDGLVATISQRDAAGKMTTRPSIFLVGGKDEAKQRAKAVARTLGLKTYGIVDKTSTRKALPAASC